MKTEIIVQDMFKEEGALWSFDYNGDPHAPHAEWTGGLCADGYTNSRLVLSNPRSTEKLAAMLIQKNEDLLAQPPDWIIGSPYSAITFSYEVARQLRCYHGFPKKSLSDQKQLVWDEITIPPNSVVIQCEELIATLKTTKEVRNAVVKGNPNPLHWMRFILTIFHYPNIASPTDIYIKSLATRNDIRTWPRENCPMCARGSPRLRPAQNWAKFDGRK